GAAVTRTGAPGWTRGTSAPRPSRWRMSTRHGAAESMRNAPRSSVRASNTGATAPGRPVSSPTTSGPSGIARTSAPATTLPSGPRTSPPTVRPCPVAPCDSTASAIVTTAHRRCRSIESMRTRSSNEGKGRGFAGAATVTAFLAAGLAAQGPAGTARVSGVVVDRDRRPVAGARVAFHYATTLGVPWLRSSAETIAVTATVAERDGRFALLVPVGIAGTCIAEGEQGVAVAARAVAGDALRMQLAPARARRFKLLGEVPPGPWQLVFEGPSPLAPRAARSVDGTLHADLVPGFGAVLALPDGFARMPGGAPWFGVSGADVDWLRLAACAPSGPAVAWAAVREAPCVRVADGRRGGASGVVWFGQLVGGEPFAARDAEPCLAPAGERRSLSARADEVVLVASVCAALDDREEVAFVAADRLAGEADRWHVPGWAGADAPALVLARTGDEWRLLDGGGAPLGLLRGRLTDEDGAPAARAAVRVRPLRCRPADAWKAFPGLEVVADERGGFA